MTWTPHVTVAAVVERGGRFLLVEERIDGRHLYNQPAGHLEADESLLEAVVRETLEETGREFRPQAMVGIYRWTRPDGGPTFLRFTFCGTCGEPAPGRALDEGIVRAWWADPEALRADPQRLRSPLVLRSIDDYRAGRRYPLELLAEADAGPADAAAAGNARG